jgi:hypothetical protein
MRIVDMKANTYCIAVDENNYPTVWIMQIQYGKKLNKWLITNSLSFNTFLNENNEFEVFNGHNFNRAIRKCSYINPETAYSCFLEVFSENMTNDRRNNIRLSISA